MWPYHSCVTSSSLPCASGEAKAEQFLLPWAESPLRARASLPTGTPPGSLAPVSAAGHFLCFVHMKDGLGRCGSWAGAGCRCREHRCCRAGCSVLCFLSEIEAKKACEWLRAAGFPQYAQLYEGESCLLLLIPVPALYVVLCPVSQPNAKGGCSESSQSCGERRGWRGLFTNYLIVC